MKIEAIKTRPFNTPKDDIFPELEKILPELKENSVLVVTSKVIAINEGRCVPVEEFPKKDELIILESDFYIPRDRTPYGTAMHTIKDGRLIRSSGVDESNADGYYILLPKEPHKSAEELLSFVKDRTIHKNLGVIITDSISSPLHRGALGTTLAFSGFNPLKDYRGKSDIFGREIKWSQANIADALSSSAVLEMGECDEIKPFAIVSDLSAEIFDTSKYDTSKEFSSFEVPLEEDMFAPFFTALKWKKGGGGYLKS